MDKFHPLAPPVSLIHMEYHWKIQIWRLMAFLMLYPRFDHMSKLMNLNLFHPNYKVETRGSNLFVTTLNHM